VTFGGAAWDRLDAMSLVNRELRGGEVSKESVGRDRRDRRLFQLLEATFPSRRGGTGDPAEAASEWRKP
jgi:hypothetical protein